MTGEMGTMADNQPKYAIVYDKLRKRLSEGRFPVGSRLPTEEQLAGQFSVSRITVRRALEQLVFEGYVNRRQGSGYSIVSLSPPQQNAITYRSSFTDTVLQRGATPTGQLLSLDEIPPDDPQAAHLPEVARAEGPLLLIRRLRCIDGAPAMIVSTWLPRSAVGKVQPEDFPESGMQQSILRILQDKFNLTWDTASEELVPMIADKQAAQLLDVEQGTPILRQICTAFDKRGRIAFYEDVLRTGSLSFESYSVRHDTPTPGDPKEKPDG